MNKNIIISIIVFIILSSLVIASLDEGLVTYYDFEESSGDVIDKVNGNSNSILIVGFSNQQTGKIGYAYNNSVSGSTTAKIDFPISDFPIGNNNRTFNYWVKDIALPSGSNYNYWLYGNNTLARHAFGMWTEANQDYYFTSNGDDLTTFGVARNTSWVMISVVYNGNNNLLKVFENGINVANHTYGGDLVTGTNNNFSIGSQNWWVGVDKSNDFLIDEFGVWNETKTTSEIATLYNSGDGLTYPFNESFNIIWDEYSPLNNSVSSNYNQRYYYNLTGDFNLSNCSFYWNNTHTETQNNLINNNLYNFSINQVPPLQQNITAYIECLTDTGLSDNSSVKHVYYNLSQLGNNISSYSYFIDDFDININYYNIENNVSCGIYENSSNLYCGVQSTIDNSTDISCDITNDLIIESVQMTPYCFNDSQIFNGTNYVMNINTTKLVVNATDSLTGSYLSDLNITGSGISYLSVNNNTYVWSNNILKEIGIVANNYSTSFHNITFSISKQYLSVELTPSLLVYIYCYDTESANLTDVNLTFTRSGFSQLNNTGNSNNNFSDYFASGNYTLLVSKSGYNNAYYYYNLNSQSYINMSVYLSEETISLARSFTVKNQNQINVENALITFQENINGDVVTVTQCYTDFNGQCLVYLNPNQQYIVRVSHPTYLVKEVSFQPVQSSYTIYIGEIYVPDYTTMYNDVSYNINPVYSTLEQNTSYTFNFSVSSTGSTLTYWGMTVNNSGIITTQNITDQPAGSRTNITITTPYNESVFFPVKVTYFFKTSEVDDEWSWTKTYIAYPNITANITLLASFQDFKIDMGITDEMQSLILGLLSTLLTIGLVGLIYRYGSKSYEFTGIIIILSQSFFAFVGWLPTWWIWSLIAVPYLLIRLLKGGQQ